MSLLKYEGGKKITKEFPVHWFTVLYKLAYLLFVSLFGEGINYFYEILFPKLLLIKIYKFFFYK